MPDNCTKVRIRMYRPGLGDCFLLTFAAGETKSHVLIDCGIFTGSHDGKQRMIEIAEDIKKELNGEHLNALAVTHEHWDHVAGFTYAREVFDDMEIDEIWVAWTEDPHQPVVKERRKLKATAVKALEMAAQRLAGSATAEDREWTRAISDVMAFNGPAFDGPGMFGFSEQTNEAMDYVVGLRDGKVPFLEPGNTFQRAWLPGVRVYVMGPPKDIRFLSEMEGEKTDHYLSASGAAGGWLPGVLAAFNNNGAFLEAERTDFSQFEIFDRDHRWSEEELLKEGGGSESLLRAYQSEDWRRIDTDWYSTAARIALQLDNETNNTSLVLAFELEQSGQVLLFVGDAQIGNWQSWDKVKWEYSDGNGDTRTVAAKDILEKTVFYKVGHHGSLNATASKAGLELMTSPALVAAIPTDKEFADRKKWAMPDPNLNAALVKKTRGRLLRTDLHELPAENEELGEEEWDAFRHSVENKDFFVDYHLQG